MDTTYLTRLRTYYACGVRAVDRHNQRAWVRAVRQLGDKWIIKQPVQRQEGVAA